MVMTKFFDKRLTDVIKRPLITEKATKALDLNQYTFEEVKVYLSLILENWAARIRT